MRQRGQARLLAHCEALGRIDDIRSPALERLERALGPELARLLVTALAGYGVRPRDLVA